MLKLKELVKEGVSITLDFKLPLRERKEPRGASHVKLVPQSFLKDRASGTAPQPLQGTHSTQTTCVCCATLWVLREPGRIKTAEETGPANLKHITRAVDTH